MPRVHMQVGWYLAMGWFATFTLVLSVLMLNMLLAIIVESYSDVRSRIGDHPETLWSQAPAELPIGSHRIAAPFVLCRER